MLKFQYKTFGLVFLIVDKVEGFGIRKTSFSCSQNPTRVCLEARDVILLEQGWQEDTKARQNLALETNYDRVKLPNTPR